MPPAGHITEGIHAGHAHQTHRHNPFVELAGGLLGARQALNRAKYTV